MKKTIALTLVLVAVLTLAACGQKAPEPTETQAPTTQATESTTAPAIEQTMPEGLPNYITFSYCDEEGSYVSLTAYEEDAVSVTIDYQGQFRKVATMEMTALEQITAEIAKSGLVALNDQNTFDEGMASGSMYIAYASGEFLSAGFSGSVPQAFLDGYAYMDSYFQTLLADVPVYVPRPLVQGNVDETALAELEAILDASGMEHLDSFVISDVPKDAYFAMSMGLSSDAGIASGTSCNPMMSVTAYSCVIAVLDDESKAADIRKDFLDDVEWNRWVCVSASHALVAQKDNMLLCLISSEELYQQTAAAIESTGWTVLETATAN